LAKPEEQEANARLIAAAPELLGAWKALVATAYDSANRRHYAPFYIEQLAQANAAIAKAEKGETPGSER
jgi:hypothetical protein